MALTLRKESQEALKSLVNYFGSAFERNSFIEPMEELDRYYHMESNRTMDRSNKRENEEYSSRYEKTDLPIVREQVQAEVPFLERIFLDEKPIFSAVRSKLPAEIKKAAQGVNAKIETDQMVGKWIYHLSKVILDASKYNFCAAEITWGTKKFTNFTTNAEAPSELTPVSVEWAGNLIRHINPYNVIFDQTCDPSEIPERGEYAGYIEMVSQNELYKFYQEVKDLPNAFVDASEEMWTSATNYAVNHNLDYKVPDITERLNKKDMEGTDWTKFTTGVPVENMGFKELGNANRHYHKVTVYCRIIPAQLNISTDGKEPSREVQIWKLVVVNGTYLMYAGPENNAHDLIPLVFGQPDNDTLGIHAKSSVQCTINIQHLAQELMEKRLASIDRNVSDRAIVDDTMIDVEQLKKNIPDAKITMKRNAKTKDRDVRSAYMSLPFSDSSQNLLTQEIPFLTSIAQRTNISNASRSGQFVKGNKTPDEVRQTMANAEAPLLRKAQQLNVQVFEPIKKMIKFNLLQKGTVEELYSQQQQQEVTFEPKTLLERSIDFKLSGGLDPLSTAMNGGELQMLFDVAQTNPMIAQTYDIFGIFSDVFYAKGIDLDQYRLPPQPVPAPGAAPAVSGQAPQVPTGGTGEPGL